jgi:hypothetical protein
MSGKKTNRKTLFFILAAALIMLGCTVEDRPTDPPAGDPEPTTAATQTARPPQPTSTDTVGAELDLREANVLAVSFEALGDASFRFDVTLLHDDDGEAPSYADSWQVWDAEGNMLGERVLTHSHGSQPFTRSATITIPANVTTVFIRGHDMEHGHGGQSMQVDLESGEIGSYIEDGD